MTIKIKPETIKTKLNEYIQKLEGLKKIFYSDGGQDGMYSVDTNIKSFLTIAFENSKERNRDYQGICIGIGGLSPEKEQEYYHGDLVNRIRTLNEWIEEMELIIEVDKNKLSIEKRKEKQPVLHNFIHAGGNIAVGQNIHQATDNCSFENVYSLIDKSDLPEKEGLRKSIEEIENEVQKETIKKSVLKKNISLVWERTKGVAKGIYSETINAIIKGIIKNQTI